MLKKELRKQMLARRGQIPNEVRQNKSQTIVEKLMELPPYQQASVLFTFIPFGHEVDIRPLIDQAVEDGKQIVIPYTDMKQKEMTIFLFEGWDRLVPGVYGILEPDPSTANSIPREKVDLILVPGVAFDQNGGRLGYGGGFYDRFLAHYSTCPPLVAPCYSEQITDLVPVENHDFRVHYVITDKEIINCRN